MKTEYKSFKEIDEQLRILKLSRAVEAESLKLNLNQAFSGFKSPQWVGHISNKFQEAFWLFSAIQLQKLFLKTRRALSKLGNIL